MKSHSAAPDKFISFLGRGKSTSASTARKIVMQFLMTGNSLEFIISVTLQNQFTSRTVVSRDNVLSITVCFHCTDFRIGEQNSRHPFSARPLVYLAR